MAVGAFISPFPSPWYVGASMPKFRIKLADTVTRRPFDISQVSPSTISGKLGTQALAGPFSIEYGKGGIFTYTPVIGDAPSGLVGRQSLQFVLSANAGAQVWKTDLVPIDVKAAL